MGLKMYLYKAPRYKNTTMEDVNIIEIYFNIEEIKKKEKRNSDDNYRLERWNNEHKSKLQSQEVVEYYRQFCVTKYYSYGTEKKHSFNEVIEVVGYWWKANQIHNWFVENVQDGEDDCEYHNEVTKEKLEELLALCKKVKEIAIMESAMLHAGVTFNGTVEFNEYARGEIIVNSDEVAELLPTLSGFFFGVTDYDSRYMKNIEETIEIIDEILETTDFDKEMIYYLSCW